jgi:hypothetical protein
VGQVEHLVGLVEPKSLENLEMTKREIVSFFVGLGVGLAALLALVCVPEIFFFALFWHHGLIIVLSVLLIVGLVSIVRLKARITPVDSN